MDYKKVLDYYSREDVQQSLLRLSQNREVVGVFENGAYSKRPGSLIFPTDILTMVKSGVVEFHSSLERWSNPTAIKEGNYSDVRVGWDIVLDLDCDLFDHGRIAAQTLIKELSKYGVKNVSIKFTGGTGIHLGISWESIPKEIDYIPTVGMFPDLARKIAAFLKHKVKDDLESAILKKYSPEELATITTKPIGKIVTDDGVNPFEVVDIDPILLSTRHLFRMPYSLNKGRLRVSLPIRLDDLDSFKPEDALPEKVTTEIGFLDKGEEGELDLLVGESLDFHNKTAKAEKIKQSRPRTEILSAIKEDIFPPCIKKMSAGLSDGRKRALFILLNFLRSAKWPSEQIEKYVVEWNQKNSPPLPDSYVRSQLRWHLPKDKVMLPPNCPSEKSSGWYEGLGICFPDSVCGKPKILIKNPINYPVKIMSSYKPQAPRKRLAPSSRSPRRSAKGEESWSGSGTI